MNVVLFPLAIDAVATVVAPSAVSANEFGIDFSGARLTVNLDLAVAPSADEQTPVANCRMAALFAIVCDPRTVREVVVTIPVVVVEES